MADVAGMSQRSVPFFCPYCGEEDLVPDGDDQTRWHCEACTRTFIVKQVRGT